MKIINTLTDLVGPLAILGAALLFFIIIPLGGIGYLAFSGLGHYIPATLAILAFSSSAILSIHQKRISINAAVVFMAGLLFLASSVLAFGFALFTQNMSILDQIRFSGILRPRQVSQGLATVGMSLIILLANFGTSKMKSVAETGSRKNLNAFSISIGIFLLLIGIYSVINGLLPLS
jgi:hypothetical protein